jgi:hypothetical protein
MADPAAPNTNLPEPATAPPGVGRSKDEVALELMKFIAVSTGYGRASQGSAGFSGRPGTHTAEEQADALLALFKQCRNVVKES